MASGIGGFAEGFSSGLGQGMGIISQVRQDKRADRAMDLQEQSMKHSMALQDKADTRAQAREDRDASDHELFTPLKLETAKLAVDKYKQDIKIGGVEYATKKLQAEWLPKQLQQEYTLKNNADARAERATDWQIASGQAYLSIAKDQNERAKTTQDVQIAGTVLPLVSTMMSNGVEPPPALLGMLKDTPFGFAQQDELARASENFPAIAQGAARGDFSFMKNGEMRESAFSLARPTAMKIARQRGGDAASARVLNILPNGQKGQMKMQISARDPKTGQYRTFWQAVSVDDLAGQMELSARNGTALRAHPAYKEMMSMLPGYASAFNGDIRATAGQSWDKQMSAYQKIIENDPDSPAAQQAQEWINQNGNRDQYIEHMAGGAFRTRGARGDAYSGDFNRVSSVVTRATGLTNPDDITKRANGALTIMGKLAKVPDASTMPKIKQLVIEQSRKTGSTLSGDPAFAVQMYYQIQSDPEMRAEMANALKGGSGKGNPSGGRGNPRPVHNAKSIVEDIFPHAHVTSSRRGFDDPLTKAAAKNGSKSWHTTGAAVDVRPIKGMSFNDFVNAFRAKGYSIIEKLDEVKHPSKWSTGPHWHIVLGM